MQVKIKKLTSTAKTPTYGTDGAGCFDIYADLPCGAVYAKGNPTSNPHDTLLEIPTGIAFEVPFGYELQVFSRSGHGFKNMVSLVNSVGIIDSDYRGELRVGLQNAGRHGFTVGHGDRIAQGHIVPVPRIDFVEVDDLSATARGTGGFGSTGK